MSELERRPSPLPPQIYASGRNIGEFCGKQRPADFDSNSNAVDLLFFTDESGDSRGWKLHYTTESKVAWGPLSLASNRAESDGTKEGRWF